MASVAVYSERAVEPAIHSISAARSRMPLGAYRFLLALIVFFSHVRFNAFDFTNSSTGFVAVICFFVVSGFIIARVLDTVYVSNVWHFLINRTLRIYPVMWAATALSLLAVAIHGNFISPPVTVADWTFEDAVRSFSLLGAFPYRVWKVVPTGWTIHIEVCFYIAIALGYVACGRLPAQFRSSAIRWYCFAWLAIYLAISCAASIRFENAAGFIPFFVLGVAIHRLMFGLSDRAEWTMFWLAFLLSLNSILHWNNVENLSIFTPWADIQPWFRTVRIPGNLVWFPIMLAIFIASLQIDIPARLRRIDAFLGDLTYPMYASHLLICAIVIDVMPNASPLATVAVQLLACLVAAYFLNRCVEQPLYPLRDAFRGRSRGFPPTVKEATLSPP